MMEKTAIEVMLYEYPEIPEKIKRLNDEISDILRCKEEIEDALKAAAWSGMPHAQEAQDPTLQIVTKIIDGYINRINELKDRIDELMDRRRKTQRMLNRLNPTEYRVIELKYFQGLPWYHISKRINYQISRTYDIHREAFEKLKLQGMKNRSIS